MNMLASFAGHPRWLWGGIRSGPLSLPDLADLAARNSIVAQTKYIGEQSDPSVAWKDVREIVDLWGGPFAIKGIMSVDDAHRAIEIGATAIIVSNHGGRQLDGAAAPIEVVPEIARALGNQAEVILDGAIRRGVHVLKALALGAKACSIGRRYLYALAANGEAGVSRALEILRTELNRVMQLSGCTDVRNIDPAIIRRF
jgi:L-lactate dehydrogenase (cytochrome)